MVYNKNFFYSSFFFAKFINLFVRNGKKEWVENQVLRLFLKVSRRSLIPPIYYFFEVIERQRSVIGLQPITRKRKRVMIPLLLAPGVQYRVSLRNIYKVTVARSERTFIVRLNSSIFGYFSSWVTHPGYA